jgi:ribosomal protein RSM22 (predicted rRNA methylase)
MHVLLKVRLFLHLPSPSSFSNTLLPFPGAISRLTIPHSQGKQPYYDARKSSWGDMFPHHPKNKVIVRYPAANTITAASTELTSLMEDNVEFSTLKMKSKFKPKNTTHCRKELDDEEDD